MGRGSGQEEVTPYYLDTSARYEQGMLVYLCRHSPFPGLGDKEVRVGRTLTS